MKASAFIEHLRATYGAMVVYRNERLRVNGLNQLPSWVQAALAGHRAEVLTFLRDGHDTELRVPTARAELKRLGLFQLETGAWCHPMGDDIRDALLVGLLDADALRQEQLEELKRHGFVPDSVGHELAVDDLREVAPGRWRWTQHRGHLYRRPFPKVTRI